MILNGGNYRTISQETRIPIADGMDLIKRLSNSARKVVAVVSISKKNQNILYKMAE